MIDMKIQFLLMIAITLSLIGCVEVKPWQKEFLAKPNMAFDPDPLEAKSKQHVFTSREGSFGGYGIGGGGCGCN